MAPMTRSSASAGPISKLTGDASWQFIGATLRSERELSEDLASSYDEEAEARSVRQDPQALESYEEREDILHPLREAADRVGREVERFAELLDGYNPLRATAEAERYEMTLDLIKLYHKVALDTVQRLRKKFAAENSSRTEYNWSNGSRELDMVVDEIGTENMDDPDTSNTGSMPTLEDLKRWEQEAQTWDLLQRLVQLRFPRPDAEPTRSEAAPKQPHVHKYSSEHELWDTFLETDSLALERSTILQWLKDTAEESGEDIDILVQDLQENAGRGDIIAHGWLHTKAAIKNQKRIHAWPQTLDPTSLNAEETHLDSTETHPLITQLDPDAPQRQNRKLEKQDEYFERAIWLGCYEMLRRGKTSLEIKEWCTERTEVWRAVSLSGLPDKHLGLGGDVEYSASSTLWRRMCFVLARKTSGDEYQRAVYGLVSGDIPSIEPICKTWDDFVFVHYNALLRAQFDDYLRTVHPSHSFPRSNSTMGAFDAVQFHGDPKTAGKSLIDKLKNDPRTKNETLQPMKMLQGVLIADQFPHFIYQQGIVLSRFASSHGVSSLIPPTQTLLDDEDSTNYVKLDDHDSLRVFTHVLLVFMALGMDLGGYTRETEVQNIIVAYISFLRLAGKEELIPLYSAQLSGARRYAVLSRSLIDVTDREQRLTQVKLMQELGLSAQEFVRMQARYLLDDFEDKTTVYPATENFTLFEDVQTEAGVVHKVKKDFFGDDSDVVDRVDMLLIRSMEWYLLVDGLWSETFAIGTILYLRFYKHMHLSAARMLASRVPSALIARNKTRAILGESVDFLRLEAEDDDLTELLDGTAGRKKQIEKFLIAEARSFRELEVFTEHLDYIETITSMASFISEGNPITLQKVWRQQLAAAFVPTRSTSQWLLNGWLLTSQKEETTAEFKLLREAYLPETILAYISVLSFGGSHLTRDFLMECMDLSAVIAAEGSDVLELFIETGRMEELVEAFAAASKTLMTISSKKQGTESRSKKRRAKGWRQELWTIHP